MILSSHISSPVATAPSSPQYTSKDIRNIILFHFPHPMHRFDCISSQPYCLSSTLGLKLLDGVVHLAWNQCQWDDSGNVHLWAENVHVEVQLFADGLDVLETLLVVGTCATDPDLDLVLVEKRGDFAKGTDDTLECAGDLSNY